MMQKYVVYSSLVGAYDDIRQPVVIDERFDYVLFTDRPYKSKEGIWNIRPICNEDTGNMLLSRYVKCHPTKVLEEYEASLYLDANIQIATQHVYDRFFELLETDVEWGGIKHPSQNCVYEEICAIIDLKWVHDYDTVNWYGRIKKDGFPEDWGLYENNVIFRRHTTRVEEVGTLWWQTLIEGCKRDQFSLMYALWKYRPNMGLFLPEGECPRLNSKDFNYYEHNPHIRELKLGVFERVRRSFLRSSYSNIRIGYRNLFDRLSRYKCPRVMLFIWEGLSAFIVGPKTLIDAIKCRLD
jgi:hypothetical protein